MLPSEEHNKITVYTLLNDAELIKRVNELDVDIFNILEIKNTDEIIDEIESVFIIEKSIYLDIKNELLFDNGSVIIVTNEEINLKDNVANRIPKELFLTKYLEEFIHWTIEKNNILLKTKKRKLRKSKSDALISELKVISRCSIFTT